MPEVYTLLLSIRPQHAARIFTGDKTVELRRVRPRVKPGDRLLIYVTAPEMALKAMCQVSCVYENTPLKLWREIGASSGIDRSSFMDYFKGLDVAYAIGLRRVRRLDHDVALEELRERWPGFLPPQSYWYLSEQQCEILLDAPIVKINRGSRTKLWSNVTA